MGFSREVAGVVPVDARYIREQISAVYLIIEEQNVAVVDVSTSGAVPLILEQLKQRGLSGEHVKYIIITHVHLDHSAGAPELLKACPHATVLCHPKAARHMSDPVRLVKGTKALYGEERFARLYGKVEPVEGLRIKTVEDNEEISLGGRVLKFLHTRGHANHHICISDVKSGSVFTGDTFGVAYPALQTGNRPFLYPTTTPVDFDPHEARKSIARILKLRPRRICLAHFGIWPDPAAGAEQLLYALEKFEKIYNHVRFSSMDSATMARYCKTEFKNFLQDELSSRQINLSDEAWKEIDFDIELNSLGIAIAAERERNKARNPELRS